MARKSKISWTDDSWNPVTGCTKVSPGCKNCYAEAFAERFRGVPGHPYEQGFDLKLHENRLELPLQWKSPSRIFVNSMSDLFHEGIPDHYIGEVFRTMEKAHWHQFQVLTKRAERMQKWVAQYRPAPVKNVWLGVSVETQQFAAERIPPLLGTPAAVRFLSCEPLLGELDLSSWLDPPSFPVTDALEDAPDGAVVDGMERVGGRWEPRSRVDWVIVGGESGHGARPMEPAWAESIIDQCREARVPLWFKQMGAVWAKTRSAKDSKGEDPSEWPEAFRKREFPKPGAIA